MTSISFPSLTSILESLWLKSSSAEPLRKNLESFDMKRLAQPQSDSPFHKAVTYLSEHSNSKLEQAVKNKFVQVAPEIRKAALNTMGALLNESNHARMLKVCRKILDLKQLQETFGVENVAKLAEDESKYTPPSARLIEVISNPALQFWKKHRHYLGKILNLIVTVPIGSLTTTATSVLALLHTPPSNIMEVQGYLYFYTSFYKGCKIASDDFLQYFNSRRNAYAAAAAIVICLLALNYLKNWLRVGNPEDLDERGNFENLNLKARAGLIDCTEGRKEEKKQLENGWAEKTIGKQFRIAMLVGPTGCGKTQFIEGIAWDCVNDPTSPFYGKHVHRINTGQLLTENRYFINNVLARIKGHEDDFILFFDEAHSAGAEAGKIGPLLQIFKTKLPPNVRICLATTRIEFDRYIKPDVAFVDRIKEIDFEPLSDEESRRVLKNTVKHEIDSPIAVDESAYDAILQVAKTDPNYIEKINPRKSLQLLQECTNSLFQWAPTLIENRLEEKISQEKEALDQMREISEKDENWSSSAEGRKDIVALEKIRDEINQLREKRLIQQQRRQKISSLQKLQALYRKQKNEMVHSLAANPTGQEKVEKNFLLLKFVLLPQIQKALQNAAASFEKEYGEKVPLRLDAEWIKARFPNSFSPEPAASTVAN
jgi:ATP-dependent Clp protease ATP-binding subunit ClpA